MKHSELKVTCHHHIQSSPLACSNDSYDFLMKIWDKSLMPIQEQTNILFLNASSEVIEWKCLTTGTCRLALFDIKLTIGIALGVQASKIILSHNHPSCILKPTREDVLITAKIKEACCLMDIQVEDHLIICRKGYFSFADEGLIG